MKRRDGKEIFKGFLRDISLAMSCLLPGLGIQAGKSKGNVLRASHNIVSRGFVVI